MKRFLSLVIDSILFLTACGNYEGIVTEKKASSFLGETASDNSKSASTVHEYILLTIQYLAEQSARLKNWKKEICPFDTPSGFPYNLASEVIVE